MVKNGKNYNINEHDPSSLCVFANDYDEDKEETWSKFQKRYPQFKNFKLEQVWKLKGKY